MSFSDILNKLDSMFLKALSEALQAAKEVTFSTYKDWLHVAKYQASQLKDLQLVEAGMKATPADREGFVDVAIAFKLNGKLYSGWFGERGDYVVHSGVYHFARAVTFMKKLIENRLTEEPEFREEAVNKALFVKVWTCGDSKELLELLTTIEYPGAPRKLSPDIRDPNLYSEFNK